MSRGQPVTLYPYSGSRRGEEVEPGHDSRLTHYDLLSPLRPHLLNRHYQPEIKRSDTWSHGGHFTSNPAELVSPALGYGLCTYQFACPLLTLSRCTKMEVPVTSGHLSKPSACFRTQHLLCHTSFLLRATRRDCSSSAFFLHLGYVGGPGSLPVCSQCSLTGHVLVSIICIICRSKIWHA